MQLALNHESLLPIKLGPLNRPPGARILGALVQPVECALASVAVKPVSRAGMTEANAILREVREAHHSLQVCFGELEKSFPLKLSTQVHSPLFD